MCIERDCMRRRLIDWGGGNKLLRELEREVRAAGRQYDIAREALSDALAREKTAPDEPTRDAMQTAINVAQTAALYYKSDYQMAQRLIEALGRERAELEAQIAKLSARQQLIIRLRYKKRLSWMAIARECYCSSDNARWCERAAVDKLAQIIGGKQ